jgi:hypothetical protein
MGIGRLCLVASGAALVGCLPGADAYEDVRYAVMDRDGDTFPTER